MLPWEDAVAKLERSRNYWICSTRPDGSPHATAVWGLWHDGGVVFGSHEQSRKARNLLRDPRVNVHLESGDDVVIIDGAAERIALDAEIAAAYGAKYDFTPNPETAENEAWFRVSPRKAWAWLESDYTKTATLYEWE